MSGGERIYSGAIRILSVAFILLGAVIVAVTLSAGGGALSTGLLMGGAFIAVGATRLWLATRDST